jgi:hypothetical protein
MILSKMREEGIDPPARAVRFDFSPPRTSACHLLGGTMRKLFTLVIAALVLGVPFGFLHAQDNGLKALRLQLRMHQKQERLAMKLRNKNWRQSVKGSVLPKSERIRMKHQMAREARELRERQKDERQDFKDRQRQMKEMAKRLERG